MLIMRIIDGLLSVLAAAFSAYNRSVAVEEGKRMVREEMYEEMVKRTESAKVIHDTGLDELIRLRRAKATSDRHEVHDNEGK